MEEVLGEPLVGKGIGTALLVFRSRGMLEDSNNYYVGRSKD